MPARKKPSARVTRGATGRPRAVRPVETSPAAEDPAPPTPDALHAWIQRSLGVTIARAPVIPGHAAPFDYLVHTFFEGCGAITGSPPAHDAPPADSLVWASRGGGKTFLGAIATLLDLVFKPGIEVRILAGSLEQARRMHTHLRRFLSDDSPLAPLVKRITDTRIELTNRSRAELLAQSHASIRGTRVQKLRCDEVDLFTHEAWDAAQLTTRSATCGPFHVRGTVDCLSTMHVPHGVMHRLVEEARAGGRRVFRWGVIDVLDRCDASRPCRADSPARTGPSPAPDPQALHLPVITRATADCLLLPECGGSAKQIAAPGHVSIDDAITMKRRVPAAVWESEMLCLRPARTDAVIPEFDPRLHVFGCASDIHTPLDGAEVIAGMDFGIRAPAVILVGFTDPRGVLRIIDERVKRDAIVHEHADALLQGLARPGFPGWPRPEWVGVDPAGKQRSDQTGISAVDVLRRAGLEIRARRIRQHDGLRLVRARLAPASGEGPRLYIHARCRTLIESLERYHYPADNPEATEPVKDGHDHAVDALRYLVTNLDLPFETSLRNYLTPYPVVKRFRGGKRIA